MEKYVLEFITTFISILYEALPFIILGALIAGLLEELVPEQLVTRLIPKSRLLAIAIGGFLGLIFPMCECGIIPVMRRLLRKGVPLSCCVCYMLAGPIINIVVILSTYIAFSGTETTVVAKANTQAAPGASASNTTVPATAKPGEAAAANADEIAMTTNSEKTSPQFGGVGMTIMRMLLGYLVAMGTALIVEVQYRKHGNKLLAPMAIPDEKEEEDDLEKPRRRWFHRLGNIAETSLHDFVDITVFLILGAILAAVTRLLLFSDSAQREQMQRLTLEYPALAILIMMGLAILLCICSEADAFIAASFRAVPAAPKLAFLVLGPMLDLKLYMMYTRVFRPRLIWTIIISVVLQVLLYSMLVHFLWANYGYLTATPAG